MSTELGLVLVWIVVLAGWGLNSLLRLRAIQGNWRPENWRRCISCHGKLVRVESGLESHSGHRLGPAYGVGPVEYVRILVGAL